MSELTNARNDERNLRRQLLSTASALALLAAIYGSGRAQAADQDEDADRSTVWIELGGQLEQMNSPQEALSPPFMASITKASLLSALNVQQSSTFAIGGEGKVSFQPESSDWVFSVSIRYGRSNAARNRHQQTPNPHVPEHIPTLAQFGIPTYHTRYNTRYLNFADGTASQSEAHAVLDFQAGKDFGLGLFGDRGTSVVSAGIRFAQFTSRANVSLKARPDVHYTPSKPINSAQAYLAVKYNIPIRFHNYTALASSRHSFHGIGPSFAWNASVPFMGNPDAGELTLDWGANAAILFGRQKAAGHHQSTSVVYSGRWADVQQLPPPIVYPHAATFNRARMVAVPNLGGFVGLSFLYSNAKVSFGYRGDFFFGAMDGGIDTRKEGTLGFKGPFASISVGLP